jgi:hypothetical protein
MKEKLQVKAGQPLLSAEITATLIECLKPGILALLRQYRREHLHIIVVDPVDRATILFDGPAAGAVKDYAGDYRGIALKKAELCARTGMDSHEVHERAPFLMTSGDVVYQGGVNYRGLVVATSGAQAPVDEAVSLMIAAQLGAWCQVKVHELQEGAAKGGPWLAPESGGRSPHS